jgi:hypothetical protein
MWNWNTNFDYVFKNNNLLDVSTVESRLALSVLNYLYTSNTTQVSVHRIWLRRGDDHVRGNRLPCRQIDYNLIFIFFHATNHNIHVCIIYIILLCYLDSRIYGNIILIYGKNWKLHVLAFFARPPSYYSEKVASRPKFL